MISITNIDAMGQGTQLGTETNVPANTHEAFLYAEADAPIGRFVRLEKQIYMNLAEVTVYGLEIGKWTFLGGVQFLITL